MDLGPLEDLQPLIDSLRRDASKRIGGPVGAYAFAFNNKTNEKYLFGYDSAGREFAFRFTPEEMTRFIMAAETVSKL